MMRKKIMLLIIGLIVIFMLAVVSIHTQSTETSEKITTAGNNSRVVNYANTQDGKDAQYTSHEPIYINGNSNFTEENGVTGGNGMEENPYIIEGWDINASTADGIHIENTDAYFIIRNCIVYDGKDDYKNGKNGIYFYNVTHGAVDNVTSCNNYGGIHIEQSSKVNITHAWILYNSQNGIYFSLYNYVLTNITITNNHILSNEKNGIEISSGHSLDNKTLYNYLYNVTIFNNTISNNSVSGINIYSYSNPTPYAYVYSYMNNIIICSNHVQFNKKNGVDIYGYSGYPSMHGPNCCFNYIDNITVSRNNISSNNGSGIYVYIPAGRDGKIEVNYLKIFENILLSNAGNGIYIGTSTTVYGYCHITHLEIFDNTISSIENGIYVELYSDNFAGNTLSCIDISNNNISYNGKNAIFIYSHIGMEASTIVDFITISNNTLSANSGNGVYIQNNVSGWLYHANGDIHSTVISYNTISLNYGYGISIHGTAYYSGYYYGNSHIYDTTIANNGILFNGKGGIDIRGNGTAGSYSYINTTSIYNNVISGNSGVGVSLSHMGLGEFTYSNVRYCNIYNNTNYGVYNYNSEVEYQVNATYNWWGSANGPGQDGANPVNGNVLYDPWLVEPYLLSVNIIQPEEGLITNQSTALIYTIHSPLTSTGESVPVTVDGPENGTVYTNEETYNLTITIIDETGNTATDTVSFIVDRTKPVLEILSPENNTVTNQNITLFYSVSDNVDEPVDIVVNIEDGTIYSDEKSYMIIMSATDRAGNTETQAITFIIDKTNPIINITGVIDGLYYNTNLAPVIDISDANLNISSITLNDNPFTSGTTISVGDIYVLVVQAFDKAGNTANKTITFTIDRTAPIITIAESDQTTTKNSFTMHWSASENIQYYEISTDGVNWENVGINTYHTFTLSKGDNTLYVRATDKAGNTGTADTITVTYKQKTEKPTIIPSFESSYLLIAILSLFLIIRRNSYGIPWIAGIF